MIKIKLTQGYFAIVDDWWFDCLNQWKWYYARGYAQRHDENNHKRNIQMHRVIMGDPYCLNKLDIDHKDGYDVPRDVRGLNNQESNLRWATRSENTVNKRFPVGVSGYRGVTWINRDKSFVARVRCKGKIVYQEYFKDKMEAVKAYNRVVQEYFGEFAILNVIEA